MNSILKLLDPYRWLVGAVLIASLIAVFLYYRSGLIREGVTQCKDAQQAAENVALREREREIARLITINGEIQNALSQIEADAAGFERDRALAIGMRDKAARAAAIAGADARALRDHATRAESDIDRSEADTERFGLEAVRASAVAHALNTTMQARRAELDAYRETLRTKD